MSLARIYTTKKVRKDWECGSCGTAIRKGIDGRISFAVGFRGFERTRCLKPECRPTRSELESSAVATVYGAIDGIDFDSLESADDLTSARDDVVNACEEVADEYEDNEMIEINTDLQERADMVRSAGEELANWEPDGEEPDDEVECEICEGTGDDASDLESGEGACYNCDGSGTVDNEDAKEEWLQEQRDNLQSAIDEMELP